MTQQNYIFSRIEKKYILTPDQKKKVISLLSGHVVGDEYGKSTICSIYLDTPDLRIIRASIDAENYKEKLRIRSYGRIDESDTVFFEIKKKCNNIVYKRRVPMTYSQAIDYLARETRPPDSQIMREIDYSMEMYRYPQPSAVICYERQAFYVAELPALRITFDDNVRCRVDNLSLSYPTLGHPIISKDLTVMEIKTDNSMPVWLSYLLDSCGIFPSTFSKYGTAYKNIFPKGEPSSCQTSSAL